MGRTPDAPFGLSDKIRIKLKCLILKFLYTFSAHKMSKKYGKKSETLQ